jgi:hypothetical protein
MDPDVPLRELMAFVEKVRTWQDDEGADGGNDESLEELFTDVIDLADHIEALDGWMRSGGALPTRWQQLTKR